MKKNIIIILMILSFNSFGEKGQPESLNSDINVALLKDLNQKIDTLTLEINRISFERNYFQTALGSQTKIFSIIVSVLLALFGAVSYVGYKADLKRHNKKIKNIIDEYQMEFKAIQEKAKQQDILINRALANLEVTIANTILKNNDIERVKRYINAAKRHSYNLNKKTLSITLSCLNNANASWDLISPDPDKLGLFWKKLIEFRDNTEQLDEEKEKKIELIENLKNLTMLSDNKIALISSSLLNKILQTMPKELLD